MLPRQQPVTEPSRQQRPARSAPKSNLTPARGHRNSKHTAGSADEGRSQAGWYVTALGEYSEVGGPDKENLAQLSRSVDEYTMGAAFQQQISIP